MHFTAKENLLDYWCNSFMKSIFRFLLLFFALQSTACVIGFGNSEQTLDSNVRRVYLPPAIDNSSLGGASSRVSYEVRRQLALNTNIQMVSIDEARLAIDIQIREQTRAPAGAVIDCQSTSTNPIGSKAFDCNDLSVAQATLAAEDEALGMTAVVSFIDLDNGKNILSATLPLGVVHPTVSADESERNAVKSRPDLHALRYFERHDNALRSIGSSLASQVSAMLNAIDLRPKVAEDTVLPTP